MGGAVSVGLSVGNGVVGTEVGKSVFSWLGGILGTSVGAKVGKGSVGDKVVTVVGGDVVKETWEETLVSTWVGVEVGKSVFSFSRALAKRRRCDLALAEAASLLVAAATKKRMIESFILSIYFLVSIGRLNNQFKVVRRYNNEDSVVKKTQ